MKSKTYVSIPDNSGFTGQEILKVGEFSYKAVDKGGEHITGTVEAVDRKSAVVALTDKGHYVTELNEKR